MKICDVCRSKPDQPCGAKFPAAIVACHGLNRMVGIKRPNRDEDLADIEKNCVDPLTKKALERYHSADDLYQDER